MSLTSSELCEQRIERCLILLKQSVEEFEEVSKKKIVNQQIKETMPAGRPLTLFIKTDKNSNYVIQVSDNTSELMQQILSTESVKALRYKIAEYYGEPPRALRLLHNDREIKDEGKTLQVNPNQPCSPLQGSQDCGQTTTDGKKESSGAKETF